MKAFGFPAVFVGLSGLVAVLAIGLAVNRGMLEGRKARFSANETEFPESSGRTLAAGSDAVSLETNHSSGSSSPVVRWELLQQIMNPSGENVPQISKETAERYLQTKGITAFNLLAAASVTREKEFARRAADLFPDHPAVQFAILLENEDLTPEARAALVERFKACAPDSPLPLLYAAHEAFQRHDSATALAEASAAAAKPGLYFWNSELINAKREIFETAGYHPLEADLLATLRMPSQQDYMQLAGELFQLHRQALKEGNSATAEEAVRAVYGIGKIFQSPEGSRLLINRVVGMTLEVLAVNELSPEVQPSFLDVPITQRKAEIKRTVDAIEVLARDAMVPMERRDANLLASYLQRFREEGEYQALLWLQEQIK